MAARREPTVWTSAVAVAVWLLLLEDGGVYWWYWVLSTSTLLALLPTLPFPRARPAPLLMLPFLSSRCGCLSRPILVSGRLVFGVGQSGEGECRPPCHSCWSSWGPVLNPKNLVVLDSCALGRLVEFPWRSNWFMQGRCSHAQRLPLSIQSTQRAVRLVSIAATDFRPLNRNTIRNGKDPKSPNTRSVPGRIRLAWRGPRQPQTAPDRGAGASFGGLDSVEASTRKWVDPSCFLRPES